MSRVPSKVFLAVTLLLFAAPRLGHADSEANRRFLSGVTAVQMVIEGLYPEAEKDGLTREALATPLELKLRTSGLRVLAADEAKDKPNTPKLVLRLSLKKQAITWHCVSRLELRQRVQLVEQPRVIVEATTWDADMRIKTVVLGQFKEELLPSVKEQFDEFLNVWLAANPKE